MARTNIDIDEELIGRAMRLYGVRTKREAVDLALRHLVGSVETGDLGDLRGTGWLGHLDELRSPRDAG